MIFTVTMMHPILEGVAKFGPSLVKSRRALLVRSFSGAPPVLSGSWGKPAEPITVMRLNDLHDNPGAVKTKRRVGRGIGSSKGKTSGRGHKGQKARSGGNIPPTFEGGQTKLYKLLPKRGFTNNHAAPMMPLNLGTLQMYIDMGRLDATKLITVKELVDAGIFKANSIKHGVKLLAKYKEQLTTPVTIHVSRASEEAVAACEAIGGTVTTQHYNQLALRQLVRHKPTATTTTRQARPPPKWQPYYTSLTKRGYLNPQMQLQSWFAAAPEHRAELESKFAAILEKQQEQAQSS